MRWVRVGPRWNTRTRNGPWRSDSSSADFCRVSPGRSDAARSNGSGAKRCVGIGFPRRTRPSWSGWFVHRICGGRTPFPGRRQGASNRSRVAVKANGQPLPDCRKSSPARKAMARSLGPVASRVVVRLPNPRIGDLPSAGGGWSGKPATAAATACARGMACWPTFTCGSGCFPVGRTRMSQASRSPAARAGGCHIWFRCPSVHDGRLFVCDGAEGRGGNAGS